MNLIDRSWCGGVLERQLEGGFREGEGGAREHNTPCIRKKLEPSLLGHRMGIPGIGGYRWHSVSQVSSRGLQETSSASHSVQAGSFPPRRHF